MPKEEFRRELHDHVLDIADQAGIKQLVSAGGKIIRPDAAIRAKMLSKYSQYFYEKAPPPPPPPPVPPAPPLLDKIELDTGYIAFSGGVPVGGNAHLSLFPNGAYSFSGHFHVSGAPSYDMQLVFVVRSNAGTAFTFAHKGRVHGTFEAGSRDDDWGDSGTNPALAAAWADLSAGYSWQWNAGANLDVGSMIDQAVKAVGEVATVIAIVA